MRLRCEKCGKELAVEATDLLADAVEVCPDLLWKNVADVGDYMPCPFCLRTRGGTYILGLESLADDGYDLAQERLNVLDAELSDAAARGRDTALLEERIRWWVCNAARAGFQLELLCPICTGSTFVGEDDCSCVERGDNGVVLVDCQPDADGWRSFLDPLWWVPEWRRFATLPSELAMNGGNHGNG